MSNSEYHSGFVALIGKPNVGKSTFLNAVVGSKVAITSSKPQTTRRRVLGVLHGKDYQIVFVDTPGFYKPEHALGRWMLDSAKTEGREADIVVLVVDATHNPTDDDRKVAEFLQEITAPIILAINKIDLVEPKEALIPRIDAYQKLGNFVEVFPVSATTKENLPALLAELQSRLPVGCPYFPPDMVSDQNSLVLAEEIIRERVLLNSRQEVPHAVAVQVEEFRSAGHSRQSKEHKASDGGAGSPKNGKNAAKVGKGRHEVGGSVAGRRGADSQNVRSDETATAGNEMQYIRAVVYVEREGQKAILLGRGGEKLKKIGQEARLELETVLGKPVYLDLWVKVKEDWRERPDWLRALGYE